MAHLVLIEMWPRKFVRQLWEPVAFIHAICLIPSRKKMAPKSTRRAKIGATNARKSCRSQAQGGDLLLICAYSISHVVVTTKSHKVKDLWALLTTRTLEQLYLRAVFLNMKIQYEIKCKRRVSGS